VKYWPRQFDEMAEDPVPVSFLNEPLPAEARPLHAIVAQSLADVEGLIARLETTGVRVADSGRGLIRDLYVQCSEAA
jgi:hypothetical protein